MTQPSLNLGLAPTPIATQSLRQFVRLLALNKLALATELNQMLSENPVLENSEQVEEDLDVNAEALEADLEYGLDASESNVVDEDFEADSDDSAEVTSDPFSEIDLDSFFEEYRDTGSGSMAEELAELPRPETFVAAPLTLPNHLEWQLSISQGPDKLVAAAGAVVGNIDEDGYLRASLKEIRDLAGVSREDAKKAVELVQTFDPPGVGARDLRECLLIQLGGREPEGGIATRIVRDFFDELATKAFKVIARKTGKSLREVEQGAALIRTLDPRPGQRYAASQNRRVDPDIYFVRVSDGFRIVIDEAGVPELKLSYFYRRLLQQGTASTEVLDYVRERFRTATQLLRNVEQRRQTIRLVCEVIGRHQEDFLRHGIESLHPLMVKDVAEEIGVHPSTVSRAVANKYAYTEHGVCELRFFFSKAVQGSPNASMPRTLLKLKVKKMIEREDAARPLTDDQISSALLGIGVSVTRRTVAKYRGEMKIPSTHRRRKKRI